MAQNGVFKQLGSELGTSLTGDVEKAILVIHDYRNRGRQVLEQNPTVNMKVKGTDGKLTDKTRSRLASDVTGEFAVGRMRAMGQALDSVTDLTQAVLNGQNVSFPDAEDKMFYVQYNPSHLTLNVSTPPPKNYTNTADGRSFLDVQGTAKLQLTVELTFDAMSTYDAFMWDKFSNSILSSTLNASAIANAANMARDLAGKKKALTVQPEVEALLSALRDPFTRTISFRWADFTFIGSLEAVRANYTMFSPTGRPIRAKGVVRITHEMDPNMLQSFLASRELLFGDNDVGNLTQWNQNWQNLINLNL